MSDFVAECRREWKQLGVPEVVADEMAADLTADLSEAAAEGVSAEEVLGAGALDPRSFAASWAAERGVIEPRRAKRRPRTGSVLLAAIAVLFAAALAAGVAILATPSATTSAVPRTALFHTRAGQFIQRVTWFDPATGQRGVQDVDLRPVLSSLVNTSFSPDGRWVARTRVVKSTGGTHTDAIGWTLVSAGIVGVVLTGLYWRRVSRRQRPNQPPDTDVSAASYA